MNTGFLICNEDLDTAFLAAANPDIRRIASRWAFTNLTNDAVKYENAVMPVNQDLQLLLPADFPGLIEDWKLIEFWRIDSRSIDNNLAQLFVFQDYSVEIFSKAH